MAVEAPHMTLFSPQIPLNRDMIHQGDGSGYDDRVQTAHGMAPLPGTMTEKLLPMYGSGMKDTYPTTALKAESGLTSSLPHSRKRSRDSSSINPPFSVPNTLFVDQNQLNRHQIGTYSFLSEDISSQIYQQQLEIDRFIALHTEKVRRDIQEMRRTNSRRLMAVAEEVIIKRLKTKEDEIVKIGQLNWSLEEKVKSLSVDNQIWRELAQTNEATANALRNNLQQVLAHAHLQQQQYSLDIADNAAKATTDQSYCGSNYEEDQRTLLEENRERKANDKDEHCTYGRINRWCRKCGKNESCVLLLPCRHLCVCTVCASSISICPVCNSTKSADVHVNMN